MPLSRRQARRQALFLLYQWDLSGQEIGSQYAGEIDPWARGVAEAVAGRAGELDARITAAAEGWTADRLGTVERSALRVAVHELETVRCRPRSRSTRRSRSRSAMHPTTARGSSTAFWVGSNGRRQHDARKSH